MKNQAELPDSRELNRPDSIASTSILSGIGCLKRRELCSFIALIESIDGLGLAKGAVKDVGRRLRVLKAEEDRSLDAQIAELEALTLATSVLRHRLWVRLSGALAVPPTTPLSQKSTNESAAALAIRASERLSPAVIAARKLRGNKPAETDFAERLGAKATDMLKAARQIAERKQPLAFPDLVREEMLSMLSDEAALDVAANAADPAVRKAIEDGHQNAKVAIAAGGSWAAFASIVGNAGFAPYILAAQVSAWVPMVSGPALVSLLATLINPATVLVGVGALAWFGAGKSASKVKSQVAARLCVILAMSGTRDAATGLSHFLNDMRRLDQAPADWLSYLSKRDRIALQNRLAHMNQHPTRNSLDAAGPAPEPWNARPDPRSARNDRLAASGIALMTAGEMLWRAAAIDQRVLGAADFSRNADIGDPVHFALEAQGFVLKGADYALRGYVAERLVLDWLVAEGHDVELAPDSNTPGFDLVVDGNPVQVKCGSELSILKEHFAKYPDIPVIANEELALQAAEWGERQSGETWADLVVTLPGFEINDIEALIAETLGHAAVLTDPGVLDFALSAGILRGGLEVVRGAIPISDLPAWLIIDGSARGAFGVFGGKAGAWVGLVAIGPAGALILGPAAACAAMFGVGGTKKAVTGLLMRDWLRELLIQGNGLHDAVAKAVKRRIDCLTRRCERVRIAAAECGEFGGWLVRRAEDDLVAALEASFDLGLAPTSEQAVIELVISARRFAPGDKAVLLMASAVERQLLTRPNLNEVVFKQPIKAVRKWARDRNGAVDDADRSS